MIAGPRTCPRNSGYRCYRSNLWVCVSLGYDAVKNLANITQVRSSLRTQSPGRLRRAYTQSYQLQQAVAPTTARRRKAESAFEQSIAGAALPLVTGSIGSR